jgi:hypothetical protein
MDSSLVALISNACNNIKEDKIIQDKEREDFEDFMIDKILIGDPDLKLYLLRRRCEDESRYADDHIDCLWWVWKSRSEIARSVCPEPYPFDFQ